MIQMKKRLFKVFAVLILFSYQGIAKEKVPNIVFILADDLGWASVGCFGSEYYETPNIDKLASQGMKFTSGYATAVNCAPSRACMMSGQYVPRHGIYSVSDYQSKIKKNVGNLDKFKLLQPSLPHQLSNEVMTIAETLKNAGYTTGMFGKWHLGNGDQHPSMRGFDYAIESAGAHYNFKTDPPVELAPDQYLSDFLGDNAIKFIEECHKSQKPFFLYFSDFLVHKPLDAKPEYLKYFQNKTKGKYQKNPVAAAMTKSLDDTVGRILETLAKLGIEEETFVVFTSDNGGLGYAEDGKKEANTSNHPLRGTKGMEFEGGMRVPYIFCWPGKIQAGSVSKENIINVDLYKTFIDLADAPLPPQPLDGVSLLPVLQDVNSQLFDHDLFWYLPFYSSFNRPCVVIRRGQWKFIYLIEEEKGELYDTEEDISETTDLVAKHPNLVKDLTKRALDWIEDTDAPRMVPNPDYNPVITKKKKGATE